jgi:hypothetical protein
MCEPINDFIHLCASSVSLWAGTSTDIMTVSPMGDRSYKKKYIVSIG